MMDREGLGDLPTFEMCIRDRGQTAAGGNF